MKPIRQIVVSIKEPADGVTLAATKAAQLARATGANLELFHAITTPIYVDPYGVVDWNLAQIKRDLLRRRLRQLEGVAEALKQQDPQPLSVEVCARWDWPHYAAIIRRAEAVQADLVVASRHVGGHFAQSVLHYADWELLRLCPVPVLLVAPGERYQKPVMLAAVDPTHMWAKPSQLDQRILEAADALSEPLGATLHAVHAYDIGPLTASSAEIANPRWAEEAVDRHRVAARREFDALMRDTSIDRGCRHLVEARPAEAIANVAETIGASVVVMGVVSRSALQRLFIGSTAETVVDRLQCDLLVVKPARFKARIPQARTGARLIPALPLPPMM